MVSWNELLLVNILGSLKFCVFIIFNFSTNISCYFLIIITIIKIYLLLLSRPLFDASQNIRIYMYPRAINGNIQNSADIGANQQRNECEIERMNEGTC